MTLTKQTQAATKARQEMGFFTDNSVMEKIKQKPGLTPYDLHKELSFTRGRIDASIKRLEERKAIDVQRVLLGGKLAKQVYPFGHVEMPTQEIIVEKEALVSPEKWLGSAFVYALDRSTLGLSVSEVKEWQERSLSVEQVQPSNNSKEVIFKLSPKLTAFYSLSNSEYEITPIGNRLLAVFKTKIPIEIKDQDDAEDIDRAYSHYAKRTASTLSLRLVGVVQCMVYSYAVYSGNAWTREKSATNSYQLFQNTVNQSYGTCYTNYNNTNTGNTVNWTT